MPFIDLFKLKKIAMSYFNIVINIKWHYWILLLCFCFVFYSVNTHLEVSNEQKVLHPMEDKEHLLFRQQHRLR